MVNQAAVTTVPRGLAQTDWSVVPTPVLTVDVARRDADIATTAAAFADAWIAPRPHFKTSQCLPVAQQQLAAGAIGFTCSTPADVRLLADEGIGGLMWRTSRSVPGTSTRPSRWPALRIWR